MPLTATVLFETPLTQIASILTQHLLSCSKVWLASGFATVEGVERLLPGLTQDPTKVQCLVLGAATFRGLQSLDRLIAAGVPEDRLFIHLGHTRATQPGARNKFYQYHPMLHGKLYFFERADGTATAFVGSHNLTGFALMGLNGEASVMLEGPANDPEMEKVKKHILACQEKSAPYDPSLKAGFAWWAEQFLEGLQVQTKAGASDAEGVNTILIIGAVPAHGIPAQGEVIYFEIPEALGKAKSLDSEVHVYLFDHPPASPGDALAQLRTARKTLWCRSVGVEIKQGGKELAVSWHIPNRASPQLLRAPVPFRPAVTRGMQQVRVEVYNDVWDKYEYLFEGKPKWDPIYDEKETLTASADDAAILRGLELIPPQDREWHLVRGLKPASSGVAKSNKGESRFEVALRESAPESGNFVLFSPRRRKVDLMAKPQ